MEEMQEFRAHAMTCVACQNCEAEFIQIVRLGLPLTSDTLPGRSVEILSEPEENFRERFLQRAIGEGFRFSQEVEQPWRALRERSS